MRPSHPLLIAGLALPLTLAGCGRSEADHAGGGGHEGHDHADAAHGHSDGDSDGHDTEHEEHDHGDSASLGPIEVGGATLEISMSGTVHPGEEVHLDIVQTAGSKPVALRFWIGEETGAGSLKSKADTHDSHFHGHVEAPSSLEGASLWIEVEGPDGQRESASVPLP